jgi:hypothetical protein
LHPQNLAILGFWGSFSSLSITPLTVVCLLLRMCPAHSRFASRLRAPLGAQNPTGTPHLTGPNPHIIFRPGLIGPVIWKPTGPGRRNPSPLFSLCWVFPTSRLVTAPPRLFFLAIRRSAPPCTTPPPPLRHLRRRASPHRLPAVSPLHHHPSRLQRNRDSMERGRRPSRLQRNCDSRERGRRPSRLQAPQPGTAPPSPYPDAAIHLRVAVPAQERRLCLDLHIREFSPPPVHLVGTWNFWSFAGCRSC